MKVQLFNRHCDTRSIFAPGVRPVRLPAWTPVEIDIAPESIPDVKAVLAKSAPAVELTILEELPAPADAAGNEAEDDMRSDDAPPPPDENAAIPGEEIPREEIPHEETAAAQAKRGNRGRKSK